ncbi:hypothetical protein HDV05_001437, partial [Chytridiales sp. JEL 0842]
PGPGRGKFKAGRDAEGLGLAHFSIAKAGPTSGWLTPDSVLPSVTSMGEKVCGPSDDIEREFEKTISTKNADTIDNKDRGIISSGTDKSVTTLIIQRPKKSVKDTRIAFDIDLENFVSCPKTIDTGYSLGTCLETTCRLPTVVEVNGIKYPVYLCRYHVVYYRSYIHVTENAKVLADQCGFGFRHYNNDMKKHPGPLEMLVSDFRTFFAFARNKHLREFIVKTMFNPSIDPDPRAFTKCTCTSCQHIYAKRPISYPIYLLRRAALVLITIYLLFVTLYYLIYATLSSPNTTGTKDYGFSINTFSPT